jgi:hypothetical protein
MYKIIMKKLTFREGEHLVAGRRKRIIHFKVMKELTVKALDIRKF